MRSTVRVFAALSILLLVVFSAGWYALTLGPENPVPWAIFSVWEDMITVAMAVEQLLGDVPNDGTSLTHAALVVGSSAFLWVSFFTLVFLGVAWCVRVARTLVPSRN